MKNYKIKIILVIVFFAFLYSANISAQGHQMHKHDMNKELQKPDSTVKKNIESIVREGTIDLKKIDKNKDGKVFQDQMDWNVISDEKGTCPLCKMTLEEVSIEKAKENLLKHGFKTKK